MTTHRRSCLGFNDFAQYYIDNNMAREITADECLKLLDKAEEAGLVLSPSNTRNSRRFVAAARAAVRF